MVPLVDALGLPVEVAVEAAGVVGEDAAEGLGAAQILAGLAARLLPVQSVAGTPVWR